MARKGTFGRAPRQAPNLTNTLVAIAREYQNQRSQNIMDAWLKGGTFEGKKATDEVVLAFWKQRMQGVSKDDPLYDTYKNAHTQLDYQIHESKMTAKYAQKQASDAEMVNFYMGWAKKVPKNSEFYRVLLRDAGQYMRTQKSNGEADRRRREEEAYQKAQSTTRQKMEAGSEYLIDTMRRIAQSGYADGNIQPASIGAPGSSGDLTDFNPNDPDVMLRLIAAISPPKMTTRETPGGLREVQTGEFGGNTDVLFHDDDGRPVTGKDILTKYASFDPGFKPGQPFNSDFVTGVIERQMQGLNERINRAKKTGHMSDVAEYTKSKSYFATLKREIGSYPVHSEYMELHADYEQTMNDPTSSPAAKLQAWQTYSGQLTKLANDPRIEADDNMRARLMAEVNGDAGVASLSESFTGLSRGENESAKFNAGNMAGIEYLQAQVDAVNASARSDPSDPNKAVWTYGTVVDGQFRPEAGGRVIGAATMAQVNAGGQMAKTVTVPDPQGGQPLTMAVTAVPIYGRAKDPITGQALNFANDEPIGFAYDFPSGSGTKTQYGFQTQSGFVFSADPPWQDNLTLSGKNDNGVKRLELDLTPVVADLYRRTATDTGRKDPITGQPIMAIDKRKNSVDGDVFSSMGFRIEGAKPAGPRGGAATEGQLVFDPAVAAWSSDTRKDLGFGAVDPMTDFRSLTLSTLMQDEDGRRILTNLDSNRAFKDQMDSDAYTSSGYAKDFKTGTWVPTENADPNKLTYAQNQQAIGVNAKSVTDFVKNAGALFQRVTTGSPFQPKQDDTGYSHGTSGKLATDLVQGTPFEALGKVFTPGTNNVNRNLSAGDRFELRVGAAMRVPGVDAAIQKVVKPLTQTNVNQGPVAGGTSAGAAGGTSGAPTGGTSSGGGSGGTYNPYQDERPGHGK